MKVCVLASGSSGNAIYVQHGTTHILIDAGIPGKHVEERLRSVGADVEKIQAIFVSHEHSDHIGGVGVLARRFRVPVHATQGTIDGGRKVFRGKERIRAFDRGDSVDVGDLRVETFPISHDAADPVNFVVTDGASRFAIATDMGVVTQLVYERIRGADLVMLESNYDREMLINGPYPWHLKQRISGNTGHLGNDAASSALCELATRGLEHAILAHLSEKNNRPDLARSTCDGALEAAGVGRVRLTVAAPDRPSPMFVI